MAHWRTLQPLVAPSLMCGPSTDSCYILHTILIDHCKHTNVLMTEFLLYRNWIRLDALQSLPPHNREGGMLSTNITGWDIFTVHLPFSRVPSWIESHKVTMADMTCYMTLRECYFIILLHNQHTQKFRIVNTVSICTYHEVAVVIREICLIYKNKCVE